MAGALEHPKKQVRKALNEARAAGWSIRRSKGRSSHAWGIAACPSGACRLSVWGTPRTPEHLADKVRRKVANCECMPLPDERP